MKKIALICIILCVSFLLPCSVYATTSDRPVSNGNVAVQTGSNSIDASIPVLGTQQIVDNVEAAFMYEYRTETLMYAWNADKQVYPSSLVKVMTALLAIERGDLSANITIDQPTLDTVPYDAVSVLYPACARAAGRGRDSRGDRADPGRRQHARLCRVVQLHRLRKRHTVHDRHGVSAASG